MSFFTYEFIGEIDRHDYGRMIYHIIFVPADIASGLPLKQYPRLRVSAEVNDFPLDGAFVPYGDGRWYLLINKRILKSLGLHFGDPVSVRFAIADQDAVDIPEVLQIALTDNEDFAERWAALTPGKQRGYAYRIGTAKRPETQEKRIIELMDELSA